MKQNPALAEKLSNEAKAKKENKTTTTPSTKQQINLSELGRLYQTDPQQAAQEARKAGLKL